MSYFQLMNLHLITVIPAFVIGTVILLRRKGTRSHRLLGRVYMLLMLVTAIITLFMPALIGSRWLGHFGWIHLLSVLVLWTVPVAYFAAKRRDIKRHKRAMLILYISALWIAGFFALMPGRYLNTLLFS